MHFLQNLVIATPKYTLFIKANSTATLVSPYAIIYDYNKLHSCLSTLHTLIFIATAVNYSHMILWYYICQSPRKHYTYCIIIIVNCKACWFALVHCTLYHVNSFLWMERDNGYSCAKNKRKMFKTVALKQINTEPISHWNVDVLLNWIFYFQCHDNQLHTSHNRTLNDVNNSNNQFKTYVFLVMSQMKKLRR